MLAPPLLVSFSTIEDYLSALTPELRDKYSEEIRSLVNRGLPPIVSSRCLAVLFGYSTKFVNALALSNQKYYREFKIRKGRKTRKIQAPKVALKVIQKWFAEHLANAVEFEEYLFGFIPGKSSIGAAAMHCGSNWVYSVDVEDFFPTTQSEVVEEQLTELGYSKKAAELITRICCYGDYLAQGAPSSPVLSNLAMKPIDSELLNISMDLHANFTRYADDIVFSGQGIFPEEIIDRVDAVFKKSLWQLSSNKKYKAIASDGQRLKVHGLLVNGPIPRLTKGYRNKIRAYRHMLAAGKVEAADELRVKGHIKYAEQVERWSAKIE